MRCNRLPLAALFDERIGEGIAPADVLAFFRTLDIGTSGHHGSVAVHVRLQIGKLESLILRLAGLQIIDVFLLAGDFAGGIGEHVAVSLDTRDGGGVSYGLAHARSERHGAHAYLARRRREHAQRGDLGDRTLLVEVCPQRGFERGQRHLVESQGAGHGVLLEALDDGVDEAGGGRVARELLVRLLGREAADGTRFFVSIGLYKALGLCYQPAFNWEIGFHPFIL